MSESLLTGKSRVSFKCSPELEAMIEAVARFEHRNVSDMCRLALHDYFMKRGYYEAATLSKLGGTHDGEESEGGFASSEPGTR